MPSAALRVIRPLVRIGSFIAPRTAGRAAFKLFCTPPRPPGPQSRGGKAIIALPSTAGGGTISRIVPRLAPGAGVVTTRGHVQWIVTEHGAVDLRGKSLRRRAELLVSIAHPDFRAELEAAARDRRLL